MDKLDRIIRKVLKEVKYVDQFTPYTEKDREENFSPFLGNAPHRNPSYDAAIANRVEKPRDKSWTDKFSDPDWAYKEALKAANERMKQRRGLNNESIARALRETLEEYGADFNARLKKYGNLTDDDWDTVEKETEKQQKQRATEKPIRYGWGTKFNN